MTPADLVKKYLELRAWLEADAKASDARREPYEKAMATIEGVIHKHLDDNGLDNIKTPDGTAFKKSGTRVQMADRASFIEFIRQQPDGLDYFTNSVSKEKILEYVKQHETAPPGINYVKFIEVQFRKA